MAERANTNWHADVALIGVVLIWGINIPGMKYGLGQIDPFVFNGLRLAMSAVALGILDQVERRGRPAPATPWKTVVPIALLVSVAYQVLFLIGMDRTTAGNSALIISTSPVWTAIIARAAGIETLPTGAWIALFVALAGTVIITLEGGAIDLASSHFAGNMLVLAASLLWAGYTVSSRVPLRTLSPTRLAYLFTLIGLPAHAVFTWVRLDPQELAAATPMAWGAVVFAGVFSTGFAYTLWNIGVRKVGPSHTAIYNNLVPVVALALSWAWLGEEITPVQAIGGALTVVGLIVMARLRDSRPNTPAVLAEAGRRR